MIGPSGSGKSSLVLAGVLPQLARGVTGLGPFVVRNLRPGEQPAARLAQVLETPAGCPLVIAERVAALLAHRGRGSSVLIVVDQLEELFTMAHAEERDSFLAALRDIRSESRCIVVFTLRADFFGWLMGSPLWAERRGRLSRIEVSPLHGEVLREAIVAPAYDLGVVVDPELVERLLADAASEPGILPLLQETMVQLWDKRIDQTLTLADYQALGDGGRSGLAVAVARRANATLRKFSPVQTRIARRVLLRLINFGEGRSDTRRQQPLTGLRAAGDNDRDFAYVLQTLTDDRLLTIDDDDVGGESGIDLGHEIMIAAWPTLTEWIQAHRTEEQRRRRFEAAALRWVEHGRGDRGLLDPSELAEAEMWRESEAARELGPSTVLIDQVVASKKSHRKVRRRRLLLIGFGVLTLAAIAWSAIKIAVTTSDLNNEKRRSDLKIAINRSTHMRGGTELSGGVLMVATRRSTFDLRVYLGNDELVARCPNGPHCVQADGQQRHIEYQLERPGTYYIVLITGSVVMPDTSPVDDFFALATTPHASEHRPEVEIQTLKVR